MTTAWQENWVRAVTTILTAAVMVMIFCFSMENAEQSDHRSGVITMIFMNVIHPEYDKLDVSRQKELYDKVQLVIRKSAHFSEYTLLGFMIRLCLESWFGHRMRKKRTLAFSGFVGGTLYAITDELHQLLIDGRSGQWTDVLVDSSGVLLGAALGTLLISLTARKQNDGE